ncbi:MAG: hypothetical protein RSB47_03010 [Ruthenibacterium sp.]
MKYEVKSFLLNTIVVLFGVLGLAQFCAFISGESSFLQMLAIVPACAALGYEAYCAEVRLTRARHRQAVALRVVKNESVSRYIAS